MVFYPPLPCQEEGPCRCRQADGMGSIGRPVRLGNGATVEADTLRIMGH